MNAFSVITMICFAICLSIFVGFLFSFPAMLLWNGCLVPAITGLQTVSWLQMWGITILCSLLFKTTSSSRSN